MTNMLAATSPSDFNPSLDEDRARMHRQMLSSVSHDLKTPLASIIGSLEVYERMKDRLSPEKQKALIHVALQEAYRLDAFVTNILDMAKLENRLVKIRKEPVEIENVVKGCTSRLRDSTFGIQLAKDMKATLDPTLLGRALNLVLDNAVKYGGNPAIINIEGGIRNGSLYISVHDNGAGVPDGKLESIFCKYTRLSMQDKQCAGTGLGLAICREIMHLLDGTVVASNHLNGGAVFTLGFPAE